MGSVVLVSLGAVYLALVLLTLVGGLKRERTSPWLAILAAAFPLAWIVWYYQDEARRD